MFEVRDAAGALLVEGLLVDAAVAEAHRASSARERVGAPMRVTVVRARDGALLAVCGGSMPRGRHEETVTMSDEAVRAQQLFERALTKAGGKIVALAAAIGREHSSIYKARRSGEFSAGLLDAFRAYLAAPGDDAQHAAALGDTGDDEPDEAPDEAAWAARPARQDAPAPAPASSRASRALVAPAPARVDDSAVTVRLPRADAERLYRELRRGADVSLALAMADALLEAAS